MRDKCHIYSMYWANGQVPAPPCFGYLYNGYVVDDSRELTSSAGWSVPTEVQYDALISHLGGTSIAGAAIKEQGIVFWNIPNDEHSTNSSGFSARGAGTRTSSGSFLSIKVSGRFWATPEYSSTRGRIMNLLYNSEAAYTATGGDLKEDGLSIRLTKDATGLSDGVTTTYTGNDGKTYNAIVINELYWITENLEETKYRNGDPIPNVTDDTTWAGLSTGACCLYNNDEAMACKLPLPTPIEVIKNGYLYNWWAAIGDITGDNVPNTSITSSDEWYVPDKYTEMNPFVVYVGATNGQKLREVGFDYWTDSGNSTYDGTDDYGFSARGSGFRVGTTGGFSSLTTTYRIWSQYDAGSGLGYGFALSYSSNGIPTSNGSKKEGRSIRLVKDATGIADGAMTTYEGNDGKIYIAIVIDELYWTIRDLSETKYRNGTWVNGYNSGIYTPISNAAWVLLVAGAMCVYDDDEDNA